MDGVLPSAVLVSGFDGLGKKLTQCYVGPVSKTVLIKSMAPTAHALLQAPEQQTPDLNMIHQKELHAFAPEECLAEDVCRGGHLQLCCRWHH